MTDRYEISSERWAIIKAIVSPSQRIMGRPRRDDHQMLNGTSGFCTLVPNGRIFQNVSGLGRP
ncbi:hypothetical protein ALP20_102219, partial [Pseudomonas coronafaciens pv. coronafaciens]